MRRCLEFMIPSLKTCSTEQRMPNRIIMCQGREYFYDPLMRFLLILVCLGIQASGLHGAVARRKAHILCEYTSSFKNERFEHTTKTLGPMPDADASESAIVRAIIDAARLTPNFVVREGNLATAAAFVEDKERFIVYKPGFGRRLQATAGTKWAPYCVFAHEIAHHILGHTLSESGSRKALELEADKWAGAILAQMGVPLGESEAALRTLSKASGDERHPALMDRIRAHEEGWRGYETTVRDKRIVKIAIVLNAEIYYAREIMAALTAELERKLSTTEYVAHFEFVIGVPKPNDSKEQDAAFSQLLHRFDRNPDFLITIGTQVSEYAYRHYLGKLPIVFVGVTDPIRSKLVKTLEPDLERGNLAGVMYGINPTNYIRFLASAFPSKRFGFLFHPDFSQDIALKDSICATAATMNPPFPIQAFAVTSTKLPAPILGSVDIFLGRYYVMANLVEFVESNPKPFVAADVSNLYKGALATISSDSKELGLIAAREILTPAILKGVALPSTPIFSPIIQSTGINLNAARKYGVSISQEAIDNANALVR
jgi:ABC-type uncharacterized transport system substrate-binding protein